MRKVILAMSAALLTASLVGCGKDNGPVVVTPEMEAEQSREEQEVRGAESAMRKNQKVVGKPTAEDEERGRARQGKRD